MNILIFMILGGIFGGLLFFSHLIPYQVDPFGLANLIIFPFFVGTGGLIFLLLGVLLKSFLKADSLERGSKENEKKILLIVKVSAFVIVGLWGLFLTNRSRNNMEQENNLEAEWNIQSELDQGNKGVQYFYKKQGHYPMDLNEYCSFTDRFNPYDALCHGLLLNSNYKIIYVLNKGNNYILKAGSLKDGLKSFKILYNGSVVEDLN